MMVNKQYIKQMSREELERAYILALNFISKDGQYSKFLRSLGEFKEDSSEK